MGTRLLPGRSTSDSERDVVVPGRRRRRKGGRRGAAPWRRRTASPPVVARTRRSGAGLMDDWAGRELYIPTYRPSTPSSWEGSRLPRGDPPRRICSVAPPTPLYRPNGPVSVIAETPKSAPSMTSGPVHLRSRQGPMAHPSWRQSARVELCSGGAAALGVAGSSGDRLATRGGADRVVASCATAALGNTEAARLVTTDVENARKP